MRILVLGYGEQGRVIARELAARPQVREILIGDVRAPAPGTLPPKARPVRVDALDAGSVAKAAEGAAVAVTALPGKAGQRAVANLIAARVPVLDLAFTPEGPEALGAAAQRAGVPVVVDCGVAPGLSNILAARAHAQLGGLDRLRVYVGGLPLAPPPGFLHAVYFHARDLLDEYVRPARMREHGRDVSPPPLDAPVDLLLDEEVGPLEAFPSDGLRTLLASFPDVPDMAELTLRVPGHLDAMRLLRSLGLLESEAIDAVARALAARFPAAKFPDRLLMEVWGQRDRQAVRYRLHALHAGGASAMARATGGTAAAVAMLLASGGFAKPGLHAPERLGLMRPACDALLADLAGQGLRVEARSGLTPR